MIILTFDVDWAPDFAIDFVHELLSRHRVPSTWLVTHRSDAIERLSRDATLVELGIHPNFRENSTHGATPEAVLQHCLTLVPGALSMRTHSLVQSTPLLRLVATTTPIRLDSSLLLPRVAGLRPFLQPFGSRPLLRVPFDWEDDVEMEFGDSRWDAKAVLRDGAMHVFNFHPIHVYLNSANMERYAMLRDTGVPLDRISESDARAHVWEGVGTRTMLEQLLRRVSTGRMGRLRDLL